MNLITTTLFVGRRVLLFAWWALWLVVGVVALFAALVSSGFLLLVLLTCPSDGLTEELKPYIPLSRP